MVSGVFELIPRPLASSRSPPQAEPARAPAAVPGPAHLRSMDLALVAACTLAMGVAAGPARWAPGAGAATVVFGLFAVGPLAFRWLEARFPRTRLFGFLGDFWLLPVASFAHARLGPLVDAASPARLWDARLAELDARLFGGQPGVTLSQHVPGWLMDVLLVCYYGHFVFSLTLGVVLYLRARREVFDEYLLTVSLFFTLNFASYALIPAVGPRYFLFAHLPGPLEGAWLTPFLDSVMRLPPFARDCFPSGHTTSTLVVLACAWRFSRRTFWFMLPPGLGLITATVAGHYHYVTDLIAAVPFTLAILGLGYGLSHLPARRAEPGLARGSRVGGIVEGWVAAFRSRSSS